MTGSVGGCDDFSTSASGLLQPHMFVILVVVPHVSSVLLVLRIVFN